MAGVVHVPWYATILRQEALAADVAQAARFSLRYGASQYAVHVSNDDRYKITMMTWFESRGDWYKFWDGPEMVEFRRRNQGRFQQPLAYVWHDEIAAGSLGPEVALESGDAPDPEPVPQGMSR